MTQYYYLLALIVSFSGLLYADYQYRLLLWRNVTLYARLLFAGLAFFLLWDICGIVLGVFATDTGWVSGIYLNTPDLPLEEFIFLLFLSYSTLITWRLVCIRTS